LWFSLLSSTLGFVLWMCQRIHCIEKKQYKTSFCWTSIFSRKVSVLDLVQESMKKKRKSAPWNLASDIDSHIMLATILHCFTRYISRCMY
jgi:hypothetical protein